MVKEVEGSGTWKDSFSDLVTEPYLHIQSWIAVPLRIGEFNGTKTRRA